MKHKFKAGDKVTITFSGQGCAHTAIGETVTIKSLEKAYMAGVPGYSLTTESDLWNNTIIGEGSFTLVVPTRSVCKQDILDLMYTTLVSIDGKGLLFQDDDAPNLLLSTIEETLAKKNIETLYDKWKQDLK
tara:strand:+ start:521 stop:913 length:393 start_codon:yes stop_codon:yes gene_type:complete